MKALTIAAMLAFSTIAGAANAAVDAPKTRTQVITELHEAQAQGLMSVGEQPYPVDIAASSSKSRAEVLAELQDAENAGYVVVGEDAQYPSIAQSSDKSRAQVQAELNSYASTHSNFVGA